ncbi:MAG: hypothetical protein H0V11_03995 [Actinobacteria bacterium]|nr:hypothetical protein [Actinomycetota bacterium]
MSASCALFGRLIDHAPTFPPAQLPVAEAIEEDRRARRSKHGWILARLAWPASKLADLGDEDRELTLIVDGAAMSGARHRTWLDQRVRAVEGRGDPAELAGAAGEVYVEGGDLDELAQLGLRAKIRCGGEHVPSIDELAGFVQGCRERSLPFKATAGLHHAVRQGGSHGFLNLLAAAVFDEGALAEEEADAFSVSDTAFTWRNQVVGPIEIERGRKLFVGFGSCSFFEPVEELKALGYL